MSDDKLRLTFEEAKSILIDGTTVHNFVNPGPNMLLGCDYDREDAIAVLKTARSLEIGGGFCKGMGHALAVFDADGRLSFFQTDAARVEAFEDAAHAAGRLV